MRKRLQYVPEILLLTLMLLFAGCQAQVEHPQPLDHLSSQEAQVAITEARGNFETLKTLPVQERYPQEFQKARSELLQSKQFFEKNAFTEAYQSAKNSVKASQSILRNFYQQVIAQSAWKTKTDIQEIAEEDPDNPLQDFIPKLDEILSYFDEIENQGLVAFQRVMDDLNQITQIEHNAKENVHRTIKLDIAFSSRRYELSKEGQQSLQEYHREIVASQETFSSLYPDKPITITLKVIGYTDKMGIFKGSTLLKKLEEGVEDEIPEDRTERREFFNQRLSEFRARAISDYTAQLITQDQPDHQQFQIAKEIVGLGETIPPGVLPPYPMGDARRRICKIYTYITTQ